MQDKPPPSTSNAQHVQKFPLGCLFHTHKISMRVFRHTLKTHLLVQTISNSSSSGLVDDSKHIETRDGSSILGSLALRVIEVGWHGNNSICDILQQTKIILNTETNLTNTGRIFCLKMHTKDMTQ